MCGLKVTRAVPEKHIINFLALINVYKIMNLKIFINLIAHSMTLYNDLNNPSISFIIMNTI